MEYDGTEYGTTIVYSNYYENGTSYYIPIPNQQKLKQSDLKPGALLFAICGVRVVFNPESILLFQSEDSQGNSIFCLSFSRKIIYHSSRLYNANGKCGMYYNGNLPPCYDFREIIQISLNRDRTVELFEKLKFTDQSNNYVNMISDIQTIVKRRKILKIICTFLVVCATAIAVILSIWYLYNMFYQDIEMDFVVHDKSISLETEIVMNDYTDK
jgi:hypothetical protein